MPVFALHLWTGSFNNLGYFSLSISIGYGGSYLSGVTKAGPYFLDFIGEYSHFQFKVTFLQDLIGICFLPLKITSHFGSLSLFF